MGDTKGGDAGKGVVEADEQCRYLDTLLWDYDSEREENAASGKAAEPTNVGSLPAAEFTTKQVMFHCCSSNNQKNLQASETENIQIKVIWLLRICQHSVIFSFLPHLRYVFLQDSFLTDTNQESDLPVTPDPKEPAPEKELKGVKFSEVAIILDADSKDNDPDDNDLFFH